MGKLLGDSIMRTEEEKNQAIVEETPTVKPGTYSTVTVEMHETIGGLENAHGMSL
jgi:hypothetical protein